ncbi:MAG: hypothetical protein AAF368_09360 [Planctomycetota bacterium]
MIESLARSPGVRVVMLTTEDGVPIVTRGKVPDEGEANGTPAWGDSAEDLNALAALAIGWRSDVSRAVAPLSWQTPHRVVLKAARGTMILVHGPGAVLLVLLQRGMRAEELRLPMEGALSRIQRILRGMGRDASSSSQEESTEPQGIHPARPNSAPRVSIPLAMGTPQEITGKRDPNTSGEA